jgi:hypothetical protein
MRERRLSAIALGLLATLTAAALVTAPAGAREISSAAETRTIATSTTTDFRVVVSATKSGAGIAPAATVTVRAFERAGSTWRQTSSQRLAEPYFWKTLTGPRAVCRLEIRTGGGRTGVQPRAVVQLFRSPSLGCGPTATQRLTG